MKRSLLLAVSVLVLATGCQLFAGSDDMTPEEKMLAAVELAKEALAAFDQDAFDAETWERIQPYHHGASLALDAMETALLEENPDAFKAARQAFWVAVREILKQQRESQPPPDD